jgi:hypothetical protein
MKMRWFMVTKVHKNYNPIKPAENRHYLIIHQNSLIFQLSIMAEKKLSYVL